MKRLHRSIIINALLSMCSIGLSGCLTLNNPATSRLLASSGSSGSSSSGSSCGATTASAVSALYAANGSNWMDHVQTAATALACNGATVTGGFSSCIHGGERRRVDLTGIADCTGITAADNLAAFDWVCDDNGASDAFVYSVSLKKGKGLKDILNAAGTAFQNNYVEVSRSGCVVINTPPAAWWTNTITVLTDVATDQTAIDIGAGNSGTIFTVPADTTIDGAFISVNKVAIVTLGTATLRFSGMGYDSDANGQLEGNGNCTFAGAISVASNASCLIAVSGADFIWIEGKFNGVHDTNYNVAYNPQTPTDATRVIYLTGTSTYNTLRNVVVAGGTTTHQTLSGAGGSSPNLANTRGYNIIARSANNSAVVEGTCFVLNDAQYNSFERLQVADCYGRAFETYASSYNSFVSVKAHSARNHGVTLNGNGGGPTYTQETTMVNVLAAGNGIVNDMYNIYFGTTRRNTIAQFTHGNYSNASGFSSSLELYTGGINPEKNTLVNQLALNSNRSAVYAEDTTDTLVNTIAGSNLTGGATSLLIRLLGGNAGFTLGGRVWHGNIAGGTACTVAANITTAACQYGGATNPLSTTLDLVSDVSGQSTDALNTHGGTGNSTYAALTDWSTFANWLRFFGLYGGTAGLATEDQGVCASATTCQIYNFDLGAGAALLNVNGTFTSGAACPASVDASVAANVLTDQLTAPNTFLINAREIIDDYNSSGNRIGDDDGLCESNESCIFIPNIGASNLLEANTSGGTCTYTGGNGVTGVTMYSGSME